MGKKLHCNTFIGSCKINITIIIIIIISSSRISSIILTLHYNNTTNNKTFYNIAYKVLFRYE